MTDTKRLAADFIDLATTALAEEIKNKRKVLAAFKIFETETGLTIMEGDRAAIDGLHEHFAATLAGARMVMERQAPRARQHLAIGRVPPMASDEEDAEAMRSVTTETGQ